MVNPYAAYKKQSLVTMTPVEVVIKLYSEIERQLAIGINAVEETKDFKKANDAFIKAQDCIEALRKALDMSVPISANLDALYTFFEKETINANIHKECATVKEIIPMVAELRDAFTQISQMTKEEIEAQEKANQKR